MTPLEYFHKYFDVMQEISIWYGNNFLSKTFKVGLDTCAVYLWMVMPIPIIFYTFFAYERRTALRALAVTGVVFQVKRKIRA